MALLLMLTACNVSEVAIPMRLSPRLDRSELSVIASLPHRTPWRVFMLSDFPAGLMESNILVSFVIHAPRLIWAGFAGKLEFKY